MEQFSVYPTCKDGRLQIRIACGKKYKDISLQKKISLWDIDLKNRCVSIKSQQKKELEELIDPVVSMCYEIADDLGKKGIRLSAESIKNEFLIRSGAKNHAGTINDRFLVINGIDKKIHSLLNNVRIKNGLQRTSRNTANTYIALKNCFLNFCQCANIDVNSLSYAQLDNSFVSDFFQYLLRKDRMNGTKVAYIRIGNLKTILYEVKKDGVSINWDAWDSLPQKTKKNKKRLVILSVQEIFQLINYKPTQSITGRKVDLNKCQLFLDMFAFSYFFNGLAPIDIIYLKRNDIIKGRSFPERWKTVGGKVIKEQCIVLCPEAERIVEKYKNISKNGFVFPIIDRCQNTEEQEFLSRYFRQLASDYIKSVCKKLGIPVVSLYGARHAYATHGINAGISLIELAKNMGNSPKTIDDAYFGYTEEQQEFNSQKILDYRQEQLKKHETSKK
ncbi:phage integrase SAM-like domain-containing protein [uncultured Parabacteroides sp.]|nr:phage integrase SAM-like domain-containing protein [uncultured Parabacteroides sp.]